jgi:hypothetical protein
MENSKDLSRFYIAVLYHNIKSFKGKGILLLRGKISTKEILHFHFKITEALKAPGLAFAF